MQGILTGLCEQVRCLIDQKEASVTTLGYSRLGSTVNGSNETITEQAPGGGIYHVMWVPDFYELY